MYKLGTLKGALSFHPVRGLELRGTAEQYWIVLQTVRRFCLKNVRATSCGSLSSQTLSCIQVPMGIKILAGVHYLFHVAFLCCLVLFLKTGCCGCVS